MDKPKIMLITSRADHGGGPKHIYDLLIELSSFFEFYIACPKDYPYWGKYASLIGETRLFSLPHRKLSFCSLFQLSEYCKSQGISIIHSHGKGGGIYSRILRILTKIPVIHTFHGVHIGEYGIIKSYMYRNIERFLSLFSNYLISVSDDEKKILLSHGLTNEKKIHVIPNGVNLSEIKSKKILCNNKFTVVSITRFDFAKNPDLVLPIFSFLKNKKSSIRLILIGDGPGRIGLEKMIKESGLEDTIFCTGSLADPIKQLLNANCYLSTSRWEGLPISVLEAMACSLPLVLSDVVGNRQLVKNGTNGFLYSICDPCEAGNYILEIANNPSLALRLGEMSRLTVENSYTIHSMCNQISNLYFQTLNISKYLDLKDDK